MAVAVRTPEGNLTGTQDIVRVWRDRIIQSMDAQKPFIRIWLSNLAFAAGQHWLVFPDERSTELRHISKVDARFADRDLVTADRITEYMRAQLGELNADDDRQQLLTASDGDTAEQTAKVLNDAVAYAWEHEWDTASVLRRARRALLSLGTIAIVRRFDKTLGPIKDHQPFDTQGQPVTEETHPEDWASLAETGQMADGSTPKFESVHEGRSVLELYMPFGILSPPGVNHESLFPWEVLRRPVPIDTLETLYPGLASELVEDTDIASAMGLALNQNVPDPRSQGAASSSRLRGHVWLYTCFERPCAKYPEGRVVVLASNQFVLMDVRDKLDYVLPNGDYHTGVTYMHWGRLDDRFFSRAFIEPMKDPQRAINMLETMKAEIILRGGPKVFVKEGDVIETPTGAMMEVIPMKDNSDPPHFFEGIGPGDWFNIEKAGHVDNLSHASTLSLLRLGENPQNVDTYSQLALLNENESGKRSEIVSEHKDVIGLQEVLGVHDIRTYWPDEKMILVTGDEGEISRATYKRVQIPDFYMVKVAKGAPQPRTQGAELKKIDAFWTAAETAGLVAQDPSAWVAWYVASVNAGSAQELPQASRGSQRELAAFENLLMRQGEPVPVADYDLLPEHLPEHREAMDEARAADDTAWYGLLSQHVAEHVAQAQKNAATVAAAQQVPSPLASAAVAPPQPQLATV